MKLLYQDNHSFQFSKGKRKLDFPPHLHGAVEVVYLLEGQSLVQCGNRKYELHAGDLFIAFPNQIHGYEQSRDVLGFLIIMQPGSWIKPYYKQLTEKLPQDPVLRKGSFEHTGIPQLLELAYADREKVSRDVLQGYLSVIFGKILSLMKLKDTPNDSLRSILLYVHEHYKEPLSRRDVADAVGYAESHISRLFCGTMRTSLPLYINALRVEEAKELLLGTDMTVSQISDALGFGSLRNFGRAFKRFAGVTPKEYRQK